MAGSVERFVLNAHDRDLFLRMANVVRKLEQSGVILPEEICQNASPECYLAQIPVEGIPPLGIDVGTASGTGTSSSHDLELPNYANCQIYRLEKNKPANYYAAVPVTGLFQQVFNFTPSWLWRGYAVIQREKYGSWIVTAPWIIHQRAITTEAIASKGKGIVNVLNGGELSDPLWQVSAWLNHMNGTSTITGAGQEIAIQHYAQDLNDDGRLGRWIIEERQC